MPPSGQGCKKIRLPDSVKVHDETIADFTIGVDVLKLPV
jgi:hypothetical protein